MREEGIESRDVSQCWDAKDEGSSVWSEKATRAHVLGSLGEDPSKVLGDVDGLNDNLPEAMNRASVSQLDLCKHRRARARIGPSLARRDSQA